MLSFRARDKSRIGISLKDMIEGYGVTAAESKDWDNSGKRNDTCRLQQRETGGCGDDGAWAALNDLILTSVRAQAF